MPDFSGNSFAEASFALDAALRSDPEIPLGPGSTGIIGVLEAPDPSVPEFILHAANIGDSRLLVLHADGSFTRMSSDQKPNDPKETKRVKRAGGSVLRTAMGVWRIDGRLALSRSFGDFRMKSRGDLLPSQQKVVALPHVRTLRVRAGDVLVYACDGVFEAQGMTWRFVANFVAMQLKSSGGDLEAAVSRLVSAAYLMGSGDNISAMLLRLLPQPFEKPSVQKAEVDVLGVRTEVPAMLPSEATVQRSGAWVNELGLYATLY
ncbi:MGC81273 protein, related [Eimeria tenella]|uniref:MGC81273 protein, related n=1 Tax=Eimeria tenella TaxID=5802 RepID=U6L8I1_EIMTE|nr:MGC81273 protein, related [Eimeria tenella]CDJ45498.1 MGC81273 protein, related [Eimeria tenella]|eukprot:XP_013236244.1 MGC81273 protein, related [Eimeria tenella]